MRGEAREEAAAAARRTAASLRANVGEVGASRVWLVSSSLLAGSKASSSSLVSSTDELVSASKSLASAASEVWPLPLVDPRDVTQVETLFKMMRFVPEVIEHYLDKHVFPETAKHQGMKLSATGQELGGDLLFPKRVGFSGTPSDLLPLELGAPKFEQGTDAKVFATLAATDVVCAVALPDDWCVESLLLGVATADPPLHTLIDVGALVTGMSNKLVAKFLLDNGLVWADGCVYLDEEDRQMVLMRVNDRSAGTADADTKKNLDAEDTSSPKPPFVVANHGHKYEVVPLQRVAALDPSRRFTFYDQVHTTGMDIKQAPAARAGVTLGKDMTLRDYAQGAWRMRQIGRGQRLSLLITPEVKKLVETSLGDSSNESGSQEVSSKSHSLDVASMVGGGETHGRWLRHVLAWLVVNGMRAENVQFGLLQEQRAANVRVGAFPNPGLPVFLYSYQKGILPLPTVRP